MTKEQFLNKWCTVYVDRKKLQSDIEAVIAHEIEKVWELEPVQGIPQPEQPAKPFDKDRFEAMFRAVVASGRYDIKTAEQALEKLDAYYVSKEGGNND